MNTKLLILGSAVLVVLLGLLGVQLGKNSTEVNPSVSATERYPFKSFSSQNIASFLIQTPFSSMTFKKIKIEDTSYFGIVEKNNYPADGILVSRFFNSVLHAVFIRKLQNSEKLLQECGLQSENSTKISFYKEDGSLLQKFTLGKESNSGGHFVRQENDLQQIFLTEEKIVLPEISQSWEDLRLPRLVQKYIRSIQFSFPREGLIQTYKIGRENEEAPLKPQDADFSAENLNPILNFLGQLNIQQLASVSLSEAGLDKPVQIVEYQLSGDAQILVSIGNVLPWKITDSERQRYVSLDFKIHQESPEDLKSYYLDWKKRSGNHIFLLRGSQEFSLLNFQAPLLGKLNTVTEILVQQKEKSLQLKKQGTDWLVLNGYDFPAEPEKVQKFIQELEELKSRPGDIGNVGIAVESYHDTTQGNIQYSLKMEDASQKILIQGKIRKGKEEENTDQYKRVYSIDDLCEISDEWGNYYIKPSGYLTLGSRSPESSEINPSHWIYRELGHFPKEDLSSIQLQIKEQLISWTADEKGNWLPNLPEAKSEDFLDFLKELKISDIVKPEEKELMQQFEQQQEVLLLSLKKKNGLAVQIHLRGQDSLGASLGKVSASYEAPPAPPNLLEIAQQEREKLSTILAQAELVAKESSLTYDLAIQRTEKAREEIALETQQLTELQQQAKQTQIEREDAKKKSEDLDKIVADLKTQHSQKEQQLEESRKRANELAQAVANLTQENPELQAQAKAAQEEVLQLQEQSETLRQSVAMNSLQAEESKKLLAGLNEQWDRKEQNVAEKTQQLQKKQENATDLSNATQSLKEKAILAQEATLLAQKATEASAKKYGELEKETALQKTETEEAQKARAQEAQEMQQQVEKINKTFGGHLVKWDRESSQKLFALPVKQAHYALDLLTAVTIQAGESTLTLTQDSSGEWKRGENYVKRDQLETFLKQLTSLDLRYGNETASVSVPQMTITLSGKEKSNVYKISAPFEVKSGEEAKHYKRFQWNESSYLIADTDFSVDLDSKNWDDLRVIRSSIKDFQSLEIESSGKSLKHLLVMKEGKLEFTDLASDHAMFESGLEENLDHLLETLTWTSFEDRKEETIPLNNILTLRRLGAEVIIRFSDPQQESVYLTLTFVGTADAQQMQTALEKKWAKVPLPLLEGLLLKREELEGLRVYVSHILLSWKGAERSKSNKTKEEARKRIEEVEKKLKEPNADFATLAKEYSDEPAAKQSGGVIPIPLQKETQGYDETFIKTAINLEKPGTLSAIIETKFGFHILRRDQ